ncbi:MAG TPA: membrane protein insertion efficiency factor YidD, partial [Candidatus Dojkabacteria bacterium]|nr:membrane protein insertion efficiency factor YidD [Candidatus Dojkabacteria bacterium]
KKYGSIKGTQMSLKRIQRCNVHTPMGTYDPVK